MSDDDTMTEDGAKPDIFHQIAMGRKNRTHCAYCRARDTLVTGPHSHACASCGGHAVSGWYTTPLCARCLEAQAAAQGRMNAPARWSDGTLVCPSTAPKTAKNKRRAAARWRARERVRVALSTERTADDELRRQTVGESPSVSLSAPAVLPALAPAQAGEPGPEAAGCRWHQDFSVWVMLGGIVCCWWCWYEWGEAEAIRRAEMRARSAAAAATQPPADPEVMEGLEVNWSHTFIYGSDAAPLIGPEVETFAGEPVLKFGNPRTRAAAASSEPPAEVDWSDWARLESE